MLKNIIIFAFISMAALTSFAQGLVPQYYKDGRFSAGYAQYYYNPEEAQAQGVNNVLVVVQDIARYGMCDDTHCFRAYVYINGDENSGTLVAVFVVSPGVVGRSTPTGSFTVSRGTYWEKGGGGRFGKFDIFRSYHSKSYNNASMPEAMFFDHRGHALHGSYDKVDGRKHSHGCVRMFPNEARQLQDWVREAGGNLSVIVRHTR